MTEMIRRVAATSTIAAQFGRMTTRLVALICVIAISLLFPAPSTAAQDRSTVKSYALATMESGSASSGQEFKHGIDPAGFKADLARTRICISGCCSSLCCGPAALIETNGIMPPAAADRQFPVASALARGARIADRFRPPVA